MGNGASVDTENSSPINRNRNTSRSHADMSRSPRGHQGFQERQLQQADDHVTLGSPQANLWSQAAVRAAGRENNYDLHDVVRAAQNPEHFTTNNDDLVFETFHHASGQEFQCLVQGGLRFYLDSWQTQQWQPFPVQWYNEGHITVENVIQGETDSSSQAASASATPPLSHNTATSGNGAAHGGAASEARPSRRERPRDDREGHLDHPLKGRVATYLFEERVNVHCYFDNDTGQWIKLPIGYEIHSDVIKDFMDIIQETIPDWTNSHDILASLRASNYDPHECISTYFNIGDPVTDPWLKGIVRTKNNAADANLMEQKDKEIEKLKKTIKSLEQQLANSKEELKKSNQKVVSLEDRVSTLEAENKSTNVRLTALQEARPKTAKVVTVEKSSVDPKTARALSESAKNLHKSHIQLKMAVKKHVGEISDLMKKAINGMREIRSCDSGQSREIEDLRELYRKEALERKLLYNKLQELRGNIRVFARCRYDNRVECSLEFPSDSDIATFNPATQQKKIFSFDKVYSPSSKQTEVFEDTLPIIHSCVDGYNVCILAYGQTGSGKTHTMMGPEHDPGVNIRSIKALLEICKERSDKADYTLKVSLLEIYNENVQDLLSSDVKTLPVQSKGNKVVIPGLTEVEVTSMADIQRVMELGNKNRTTAATKMNSQSSRSHLILKLSVEGLNRKAGTHSSGSLMLCDLAGSERVGKTEAQGQRLVEAAAINKSLTALGQVFSALRASQLHIPYRNSKLTHILQPALGGDAKACLFVAVSPDVRNITETISTLTFGSNARQIALGQAKANVSKRMPKDDDDD